MAIPTRAALMALALGSLVLAGCAGDGGDSIFTTGSLASQQTAAAEPKIDPVCVTLVSRIDTLRREGIADKIEKAAAKRYKMTQADLNKADQLTKASAEFQLRCSTITPKSTTAQLPAETPAAAPKAAGKKTATKTP
jgi:hypothetical protein